ncbi:MAG: M28 family peptidase [Bacteroidia bacterium]|nr:M28 family peptidase [Bacteroidia bacterium]
MYRYFLFVLSVFIFTTSCNNPNNNTEKNIHQDKKIVETFWQNAPAFNADSCYYFVNYQVQLGPRNPGSKAHQLCVEWIKNFFEKNNVKTELQKFSGITFDKKQWTGINIIAKYKPELKNRILLCTHYDTRPFADRDSEKNKSHPILGANDGGSGVAVLMSILQAIHQKPLQNTGIDFVFFDLEDYGNAGGESETWCLGSQYWAKNIPLTSIKPQEGILLDMVGDTNAVFPKEGLSIRFHPVLVHNIWSIAQKAGYSNYFIDQSVNEITDDHLFINTLANIPCIDIVHYYPQKSDFFEHHHKISDDIKNISKTTLKAVGQTLLYYLYQQDEKHNAP